MKQRLAYSGMGQRPMFAGGGGIPAEDVGKVKVSVEDSVEQFLNDKIIVEGNITKEIVQEIVGGCPIGKTFYEGGTIEYPFSYDDIQDYRPQGGGSNIFVLTDDTIQIDTYDGILRMARINYNQSDINFTFEIDFTSAIVTWYGEQISLLYATDNDRLYLGYDGSNVRLYFVESGVVSSEVLFPAVRDSVTTSGKMKIVSYSGGIDVSYSMENAGTVYSGNVSFSSSLVSNIYNIGCGAEGAAKIVIDRMYAIGTVYPYSCAGEIYREKLKLSSPVSDFTTSFEFSNANQITVNTIIQCPSGEGNFGGANPNGTRSYFPGSSITGVKVDIRKYVTNGAGSITIQIRSRLADGNNTTDVSPTAGTLRYETTIPLQDTSGAERFGLSVTDEFRENPIVFTESEEVFVVVSGLTAQEVRGLLVDTALRASV